MLLCVYFCFDIVSLSGIRLCSYQKRFNFSLKFPFFNYVKVLSSIIFLDCRLIDPSTCFSSHFCFLVILVCCFCFLYCLWWMQSVCLCAFYIVFEPLYRCIDAFLNVGMSSSSSFSWHIEFVWDVGPYASSWVFLFIIIIIINPLEFFPSA